MLPIQKRVISLLLAFLLGFTSVGYSIDLHFCQGHLKSVALIGKAKSCHEMEDDSIQQPFKPVLNENQIVSNEIMSDSAKNYKNPDPPNSHGQLIRVVHCSFLC